MSWLRKAAEIPAGSWTKWVVVGFWVAVLVITFPLAGKLTGAEKNDTKAWLPANAESTKVLDVVSRTRRQPGCALTRRLTGERRWSGPDGDREPPPPWGARSVTLWHRVAQVPFSRHT